jgi:hypothetical protein
MDVQALFMALHRNQISYVLFGTLGAVAHGAQIITYDADICPARDQHNFDCISSMLVEIKARPIYIPGWNTQEAVAAWKPYPPSVENLDHALETMYGNLDVCPFPFGPEGKKKRFDYETLNRRAVTIKAFGLDIPVAHLDDLIASKMSAKREKDNRVWPELERLAAGELCNGGLEWFAGATKEEL